MLVLGVTLHAQPSAGAIYYSPWFPRQGNAATFSCEVTEINGATLTITIETKNEEDADNDVQASADFSGISSATSDPATKRMSDLRELVRFKYKVVGVANTDWVHFRMLNPVWETN